MRTREGSGSLSAAGQTGEVRAVDRASSGRPYALVSWARGHEQVPLDELDVVVWPLPVDESLRPDQRPGANQDAGGIPVGPRDR